MYTLTLTRSERRAMDWIGARYFHGDELFRLLWARSTCAPEDADWDDPRSITFSVPEHVAWEIRDGSMEDDAPWCCFAPKLREKMEAFVDSIV